MWGLGKLPHIFLQLSPYSYLPRVSTLLKCRFIGPNDLSPNLRARFLYFFANSSLAFLFFLRTASLLRFCSKSHLCLFNLDREEVYNFLQNSANAIPQYDLKPSTIPL
ncbi:unnamed protein product [Rhizopus microsporus]